MFIFRNGRKDKQQQDKFKEFCEEVENTNLKIKTSIAGKELSTMTLEMFKLGLKQQYVKNALKNVDKLKKLFYSLNVGVINKTTLADNPEEENSLYKEALAMVDAFAHAVIENGTLAGKKEIFMELLNHGFFDAACTLGLGLTKKGHLSLSKEELVAAKEVLEEKKLLAEKLKSEIQTLSKNTIITPEVAITISAKKVELEDAERYAILYRIPDMAPPKIQKKANEDEQQRRARRDADLTRVALTEVIFAGDLEAFKAMEKSGVCVTEDEGLFLRPINIVDSDIVLGWAIKAGQGHIVDHMISSSAKQRKYVKDAPNPVFQAILYGQLEIASKLLELFNSKLIPIEELDLAINNVEDSCKRLGVKAPSVSAMKRMMHNAINSATKSMPEYVPIELLKEALKEDLNTTMQNTTNNVTVDASARNKRRI